MLTLTQHKGVRKGAVGWGTLRLVLHGARPPAPSGLLRRSTAGIVRFPQVVEADEGAPEVQKRLLYVRLPLVAYRQPAEPRQPRQCPFHYPPVAAQPLARANAAPGDARLDPPLAQRLPAAAEVVALVRGQILGPLPWPAPARALDRLDAVEEPQKTFAGGGLRKRSTTSTSNPGSSSTHSLPRPR